MEIMKGTLEVVTGRGTRFIFKPVDLLGAGYRTIPYNEVIAYRLSELFGFNVVPKTTIAAVKLNMGGNEITMVGSLQTFIPSATPLSVYRGDIEVDKVHKIIILDTLVCNTDRVDTNVVVDEVNNPFAVDNGFSLLFHTEGERELREEENVWEQLSWFPNPYDLNETNLRISNCLLDVCDPTSLYDKVQEIQSESFKLELTDLNLGDDYEEQVKSLIQHRIKYLPALIYRQFEERGNSYERITPI